MQRAPRGSGINVDPARVKRAREEAGLSLAQVARDDVSRTFLYLVEQGRSRPSKAVLALIARRTHKPMTYFIKPGNGAPTDSRSLPSELSSIASRVHHLAVDRSLSKPEQEAMKLVEISIRQAGVLTAAILKAERT